MVGLCCVFKRKDDRTLLLFREQFERIKSVYPGTTYACLLNAETGEIIAQSDDSSTSTNELSIIIAALKRAALHFAGTMNQVDSQIVHVKGEDRMFSCYGLDDIILAFYSNMHGVDMEVFDCCEADKNMDMIHSELKRLVNTSDAVKKGRSH